MVTENKLRILLLGDSRSFKLESYVPELRRQDCEVLLTSIENGTMEHFQLKRVGPIGQLHYTLAVPELRKLISRYRPDVVDAHDANYGYMAAMALKNSLIPFSVCLLGPDIVIVPKKSILHRLKTVFALRRADAVVADSQYLLGEAKKLSPLKLTMVAPFGIEERYLRFHKLDYTVSRPLKIIVPRHQEKVYNNEFILKSLAPLLKAGSITLTFADFGSMAGRLKSKVREWDCPNVQFYKRMERELFLRFMSGHDVYLSAALTDSSPVSLIDAMAMGLIPVIADTPGVKEWLEESHALTFLQNNSNALVAVINRILENKVVPEIRSQNLLHVRQNALFEKYVAARINLLKRLAGHL